MLTQGARSAGEPQLYGEGKPEEELLVMEGQIAGHGWFSGGAPADFGLILGQGKVASNLKIFVSEGRKAILGDVHVSSKTVPMYLFLVSWTKKSKKCFHKKTEN